MKKYTWIILIGIIIFAALLRLWQLGNVPASLDWDEAALGYNAYSIINTGKDEFGKFLPVVLRSFDDYKPALYAYIAIPSILIFGLNVFAVRLPSAVFGIVSVIAVFFLCRELFKNYKYKDYVSLVASFILAISPWSLQFSRVGFESNVGDSLNILMALFFIKGLKKPWILILAAACAGLSIYVYQSEKVFTPLLALFLIFIFRKDLFLIKLKYIFFAIFIGIIIVIPMMLFILNNKSALLRVTGTSIFSSQNEILQFNVIKLQTDIKNNDKLGLILDNRRLVYATTLVSNYLSHFDIDWLFIKGDIARHHAPNMGLLYIFELPLLLIGIYKLIFGDFDKKTKLFIFGWFLIAPIPAAITTGVPHAVRTLNFLPIFQLFIAIGVISVFEFIYNLKQKFLFFRLTLLIGVFYFLFAIFNFIYYLDQYFVQQNYFYSKDWQYGYKQAVEEVLKQQSGYKQIVIANDQTLDQSYIYFLFYLKYPPVNYQNIEKHNLSDSLNRDFGKYTFRSINWQKDAEVKNTLYIAGPGDAPKQLRLIKTIYNLDGSIAIKILGTKVN